MAFAAIARVAQDSWTACAVQDTLEYGLVRVVELGQTLPGDTVQDQSQFHRRALQRQGR